MTADSGDFCHGCVKMTASHLLWFCYSTHTNTDIYTHSHTRSLFSAVRNDSHFIWVGSQIHFIQGIF